MWPLWLLQFKWNLKSCSDCSLQLVSVFNPSFNGLNVATFSSLLQRISAARFFTPRVRLMSCRTRLVIFFPPFHSRHRRSGSRSRGGRRSRSRERDHSRRKGHDREREKERDRAQGRDKERDKTKEKADKKRWIDFWHMITHAKVDSDTPNMVRYWGGPAQSKLQRMDFRLHLTSSWCPSITCSFYPSVHHYLLPLFPVQSNRRNHCPYNVAEFPHVGQDIMALHKSSSYRMFWPPDDVWCL